MRSALRSASELLRCLDLAPDGVLLAEQGARDMPVLVPRPYLRRIAAGDPKDPLLLQVLPLAEEDRVVPGFVADPLAESASRVAPGALHKYRGRSLLVATGACAIHCRYCFRRHFPYAADPLSPDLDQTVEMLRTLGDKEVILSGGDPLLLRDDQLRRISDRLRELPSLERLRIHTRVPIVLPQRIDSGLLAWLETLPWSVVVVVHCNHPRELDTEVRCALQLLDRRGVTLLNQTVLLRGVNDRAEVLRRLSEELFRAGVLPYYLHLLDRVAGAAHFDVAEEQAQELVRELRLALPGYLVPRLVREEPGAGAKLPVA